MDRTVLKLLPDHLLKPLHMVQRSIACRQMGNLVFRVQGTAEMQPRSSIHTFPGSYCSMSVQRDRRYSSFLWEVIELPLTTCLSQVCQIIASSLWSSMRNVSLQLDGKHTVQG